MLQTGDTVVLIKDLDVKGGGITAKRGTAVDKFLEVEMGLTSDKRNLLQAKLLY